MTALGLNDVLTSIEGMLRRLIPENVDIEIALAPSLPAILADRIQLEQIVLNLCMNARDAMPQGGHLRIRTARPGPADAAALARRGMATHSLVKLIVADTGVGMDSATQARIFEPFFTTKAVGHGTGLGLATVYGVIQQLGGQILVDSEPGRGTTFTMYFPQAPQQHATAAGAPTREGALVADAKAVVLVIEDQADVRQLLVRVLARHGYSVVEADGPAAAIALESKIDGPVDLILSDVVMPGMSGPDVVRQLKERRPEARVLFMSGYADAMLNGPDASIRLLEKPFTASTLLQAVRDSLNV